jgi:hypothetical protein
MDANVEVLFSAEPEEKIREPPITLPPISGT